jgi:hypothetical protein
MRIETRCKRSLLTFRTCADGSIVPQNRKSAAILLRPARSRLSRWPVAIRPRALIGVLHRKVGLASEARQHQIKDLWAIDAVETIR